MQGRLEIGLDAVEHLWQVRNLAEGSRIIEKGKKRRWKKKEKTVPLAFFVLCAVRDVLCARVLHA